MKWADKRAREIIKNYAICNLQKINVVSGECRFNYKCQQNSVHEAIKSKENNIVMAIYIEDDYPVIHFLNVNKNGKYTDNTLGHWSEMIDYYFVNLIEKESFFKVNDIFSAFRKDLRNRLPLFIRMFAYTDF